MDMAADMQANGEEDKCIQNFSLENLKERNHVEDHTLHGKVRFKCTKWFKYDRDCLCVNLVTSVPAIFEPPC